MTTIKPTPAPWTASIGWGASDIGIYANNGETYVARVFHSRERSEQANGPLISAAPDLYKAALRALHLYQKELLHLVPSKDAKETIALLTSALSKADGLS